MLLVTKDNLVNLRSFFVHEYDYEASFIDELKKKYKNDRFVKEVIKKILGLNMRVTFDLEIKPFEIHQIS